MLLVKFKYYNPVLKIAFNNWGQVYLLPETPVLLKPEPHRSALVYRLPGTTRCISYKKLKQGMVNREISIWIDPLPKPEKIDWL